MQLITVTCYLVHMTVMVSWRSWVQTSRSQTTCRMEAYWWINICVLFGLPTHLMRRLQSVLNAAVRLIYRGLRTRDHITDTLISLHWLRAPERIQYKLAILAYRVLHGDTPRYLGPLIRVDDLPGRRPLRSSYTNRLVIPQVKLSAVEHLWLRLRTSETCLTNSRS